MREHWTASWVIVAIVTIVLTAIDLLFSDKPPHRIIATGVLGGAFLGVINLIVHTIADDVRDNDKEP